MKSRVKSQILSLVVDRVLTAARSSNSPFLEMIEQPYPCEKFMFRTSFRHAEYEETELPLIKSGDLAPKFYPVLSSLQRFWVVVVAAVAAGRGAEPFRLRSTASRRGLIV
jgi:hypothetical protein